MKTTAAGDLCLGLAAAVLAFAEIPHAEINNPHSRALYLVVGIGVACAIGLSRRAPGLALAIGWILISVQAETGLDVMLVESGFVVLAFGAARWGSTATLWTSAASIPLSALLLVYSVRSGSLGFADYRSVLGGDHHLGGVWTTGAAAIAAAMFGLPWLAGLALRASAQARSSRQRQIEAEQAAAHAAHASRQAREIAELRHTQAALANDVHDVVGHSLAVILAQAEAAQLLEGANAPTLKQMLENIAGSARASLGQIREVLGSEAGAVAPPGPGDLDSLIESVRSSGREIVATDEGKALDLGQMSDGVAFRVLQEMLTNALKHGVAQTPIFVKRCWSDRLTIEVRNRVAAPWREPIEKQGLGGMRQRLESVGGALSIAHTESPEGPLFTSAASIPKAAPVDPS